MAKKEDSAKKPAAKKVDSVVVSISEAVCSCGQPMRNVDAKRANCENEDCPNLRVIVSKVDVVLKKA